MIGTDKVLGLIPARGGSKGVSRKNLRLLAGKPLLQWTAEVAKDSKFIDRLVLSTEDDELAALGLALGLEVPFRRPAELASDNAHVNDVIRHALAGLDEPFDLFVLLEPTSPLRSAADIDACIERISSGGGDFCVSVQPTESRPEWMFFINETGRLDPVIGRFDDRPRQDLPPCYLMNGAVYAARVEAFERANSFTTETTIAYPMPAERSVDINLPADFEHAEAILSSRGLLGA